MVKRMIVASTLAMACMGCVVAWAQEDVRALVDRAKANAAAYPPAAQDGTIHTRRVAPTADELQGLVNHATENAREIVGPDLADSLPGRVAQAQQTYAGEMAQIQEWARGNVERGIELARELAGSQMEAVESQRPQASSYTLREGWQSPRYRLFISQAMPEEEVKGLLEMARGNPDVVLVLRGMKPNQHFMAVGQWFAKMLAPRHDDPDMPAMTIDPEPFAALGVDQVPVIAEYDKSGKLMAYAQGITSLVWMAEQTKAGKRGNLGVYGPTVTVAELDIIEVIKGKVAEYDWEGQRKSALARYWANNTPRHELPRVTAERVRWLDPTFEVTQSIVAPDGQVIARAGDRVNPLDAIDVPLTLAFFNPADPDQVRWTQRFVQEHKGLQVTLMASQLHTLDGLDGLADLSQTVGARVFGLPEDVRATFHIERVPTVVTVRNRQYHIHEQVP